MNKKRLALLLALMMLFSCAALLGGCSGGGADETSVAGDWTATVDCSGVYGATLEKNLRDIVGEAADGVTMDMGEVKATVTWELSLAEDGTCTLRWQEQEPGLCVKTAADAIRVITGRILDAMLAEANLTREELEQETEESWDVTVKGLAEGLADDLGLNAAVLNGEASGTYTVEGDKLNFQAADGGKLGAAAWMTFQLQDGNLVITGADNSQMDLSALMPITMTRV